MHFVQTKLPPVPDGRQDFSGCAGGHAQCWHSAQAERVAVVHCGQAARAQSSAKVCTARWRAHSPAWCCCGPRTAGMHSMRAPGQLPARLKGHNRQGRPNAQACSASGEPLPAGTVPMASCPYRDRQARTRNLPGRRLHRSAQKGGRQLGMTLKHESCAAVLTAKHRCRLQT